jgi:regulator of PEP synthase PpsR (kinase-PPPase family)
MLVEVERPSKPILVGDDARPSYQLTQAVNQVSVWDEIIRRFGDYLQEFPSIRNHRSLIIIGREHSQKFGSNARFREELNRVNQLYSSISVMTFDDLLERARIAIARIKALHSALG